MKRNRMFGWIYLMLSVGFEVLGVIGLVGRSDSAGIWICLGSAFLLLGVFFLNKSRENRNGKKDK